MVAGANPYLYDLDVTTFITHTFSSDLAVTLTSPAGRIATLTTGNGQATDNVFNGTVWDDDADPGTSMPSDTNQNLARDHTYVDNVVATPLVPEEPLGAFIGENPNGTWTLTISDNANGDGGSLDSWSLHLTTLPGTPPTSSQTLSNNTPLVISSGVPSVITSSIEVAGADSVVDVNVTTMLQHDFYPDVDMSLTSPSGTIVQLTTDNGGNFENVFNGTVWDDDIDPGTPPTPDIGNSNFVAERMYSNTVASPLIPEEALAAFTGENANGTWTLTIADDSGADGGSLNGWTLELVTASCAPKADLAITKSDTPDPVTPGGTITYTLDVTNIGPNTARNATVTDTIPANTRFVSATASGPGWVVTAKPSPGATGTVRFTNSQFASGGSGTLTVVVKVNSNVGVGAVISNTASIGSRIAPGSTAPPTQDPNAANDSVTVTTTVGGP